MNRSRIDIEYGNLGTATRQLSKVEKHVFVDEPNLAAAETMVQQLSEQDPSYISSEDVERILEFIIDSLEQNMQADEEQTERIKETR